MIFSHDYQEKHGKVGFELFHFVLCNHIYLYALIISSNNVCFKEKIKEEPKMDTVGSSNKHVTTLNIEDSEDDVRMDSKWFLDNIKSLSEDETECVEEHVGRRTKNDNQQGKQCYRQFSNAT